MKTLLVIDCQKDFYTSKVIMPEVLKWIRLAIYNSWPVVVLEFEGYGPTHSSIQNTLKHYALSTTVVKQQNGGGHEVDITLTTHQFPRSIVAVGVNRGYCVHDTVSTLARYGNQVEVVEKATWGHEPEWELERLRELKGIQVI